MPLNWQGDNPCANWTGVTCDASRRDVIGLIMAGPRMLYNKNGMLIVTRPPVSLGLLKSLKNLSL